MAPRFRYFVLAVINAMTLGDFFVSMQVGADKTFSDRFVLGAAAVASLTLCNSVPTSERPETTRLLARSLQLDLPPGWIATTAQPRCSWTAGGATHKFAALSLRQSASFRVSLLVRGLE